MDTCEDLDLSFEEVRDFIQKWPGEPASGTPPVTEDFAVVWMTKALRTLRGRSNWQRILVADWRAECRGLGRILPARWEPSGAGEEARRGRSEVGRQLALQRLLEHLTEAIETHPANILSSSYREDCTGEQRAELKRLRERRNVVKRQLLEINP